MCRAIVKKGSLSLTHRATAAGHIAYVLDNDRKICKSEKTGIWMDGKFIQCDHAKRGEIFIPYATRQSAKKLILVHDGFA